MNGCKNMQVCYYKLQLKNLHAIKKLKIKLGKVGALKNLTNLQPHLKANS